MPTKVTTVPNDYGNERRAGVLTGTLAEIAADANVHEFWPMAEGFISGVETGTEKIFQCRPAKSKSKSRILRPAEFGYRPQYFTQVGGGLKGGFLRMGQGANGGPSGGTLNDTNNGALITGLDAHIFPLQDGANSFKNSYTLTVVAKTFPGSTGDDIYPGAVVGNVNDFPDSSGTLSNWGGIGIGFGTTSEDDVFFAARGTTGRASSTVNRADGNWYVYTGIYDVANGNYKLRVNGSLVTTAAWPAGVLVQSSSQRPGYTAMRVGSAGDIGAPIERTFIGDVGPIAVMHVAGDDAAYLASLVRIETAFMAMFGL